MTFDQLEALEMIVEKGSFKAAAEAMRKTQPTLSISIKKLEDEFDLLLFNREEYRPSLTEEGKVFFNWARECLRSYRELATVGKELGTRKVEPNLHIVVDPFVPFEALEGIFEECLAKSLPTELTLRSEILGQGMELLLDQQVDFAVAPMLSPHKDIESILFNSVELLPCISAGLLGHEQSPDRSWLQTKTQIIARSFTKVEKKSDTGSLGVLDKGKRCYVSDHSMKRKLILEGFGWGRLARHEVEVELKEGQLILVDQASLETIEIKLHLMRNKLKPMGPVAKAIWSRLKAAAAARN
ncbi:MAG: LysR family transcriptional regulator [Proteobacteria bacterium]|nr:MAG: LysR family transcriptional regulator [Pseudomonadota bacterium]